MTNEIAKPNAQSLTELLNNTDKNIYHALKTSVYPGASDESVSMVLAYCKAKKYDPLAKAVHIVPMQVKTGKKAKSAKGYEYDETEKRDVIMPGIASYRIDADRTGQYAGMTEPEFGPTIIERLGEKEVRYPEWCKITVKKLVNGQILEFTAKEYWIENYATSGKDSLAPNAMWFKRPRGQLAKCTEAQALRKAFPDSVSALPTFDEMEGKSLDIEKFIETDRKTVHGQGIEAVKNAILPGRVIDTPAPNGWTNTDWSPDEKDGSLEEATQPPSAPSFADIKKQMDASQTIEDLVLAKDIARSLSLSEEQKKEINEIWIKKNKELGKK